MSIDLVRWAAQRLPGVDPEVRQDLAHTAGDAARDAPVAARLLELASLVGFALRATSRRGTADDRGELVRQGVRVGGLVVAIAVALMFLAAADDRGEVVLAIGAGVTAVAIAAGSTRGALLAAGTATVLGALVSGAFDPWSLAVLGAVAVGHRFGARPCPVGAAVCAAGIVIGGVAVAAMPGETGSAVITVAIVGIAGALLAIGWFDPRYAVAATVVWAVRFAGADPGSPGWAALVTGVVLGVVVSGVAIRRTVSALA